MSPKTSPHSSLQNEKFCHLELTLRASSPDRSKASLGGHFRPRKKIFSPPPLLLADILAAPVPPPTPPQIAPPLYFQ